MKNKLILIVISFSLWKGYSQSIPTVTLNDDSKLKLSKLNVTVEIMGDYSTVSYDMTFYNGLDRILEGELAFPLGQGQSVSHFAMELNGQLRDAVVVEKEVGRVAYENTIRQRIDPALLEQTKGNNYKARVYPIPAKGYKRIVVTYEQSLAVDNGDYVFSLPFDFKKRLDAFELEVIINNMNSLPKVCQDFEKQFQFHLENNRAIGRLKAENFKANKSLCLQLPVQDDTSVITYKDYFHANTIFKPKTRLKEKPNSMTVLWDASLSMNYRNLEAELNVLDAYMDYLQDVKVHLIVFSNTVITSKTFRINDGQWGELKNVLKHVRYDGGTSYKNLPVKKTDEVLLFSDGMHNLGHLNGVNKGALYCINSLSSADHDLMETMATLKGGDYLNLNILSSSSALNRLKNEPLRFIGVDNTDSTFEIYPKPNAIVNESFSVSGKFVEDHTIQLLFGYGREVTDRVSIDLSSSNGTQIARRLWAKSKLKVLLKTKSDDKDEIIEHAKTYHFISPYTSMIVLDRIEDYVRYRIEPPKELLSEYKRLLSRDKDIQNDRLSDFADRKEELKSDYKTLRDWYNKDFSIRPKATKRKKAQPKQVAAVNDNSIQEQASFQTVQTVEPEKVVDSTQVTAITDNSTDNQPNRTIDTTKTIIAGTVTAVADGLPLPGANIYIKDANRGTQTDFDGNYAINAEAGEVIVFSFVGYETSEFTIGSSTTINIVMEEDSSLLDEVVVVGYMATRSKSISVSSVSVSYETAEDNSNVSFVQTLSGQVSGLNITTGTGQPGSGSVVQLRGTASINGDQPLFILDGVPLSEEEFRSISAEEIESVNVLKGTNATAIYGSRGVNGVIIITTKKGAETHKDQIEALNTKINEQLTIHPWQENSSYMSFISEKKTIEQSYDAYLKIRDKYINTPTFFLDVADFFEAKGRMDYAIRIATNLIEIELDNHELIRALGYKLDQYNEYGLATYVYETVLELRPEEPQSYRDLALAYQANGQIDQAHALLSKIVNGDLLVKDEEELFYGIEQIAYVELCHLINSKGSKSLKHLTQEYSSIETDIRVVIDWNHDETDLDLYIKNPSGEVVYYSNSESKYGGRLSEDLLDGYGPESFMIKKAPKGDYEISVEYYSDRVQKITGPTSVKVTIYRNYGKANQEKEVKLFRIHENDLKVIAGTIKV